jgi:hypothetical protein
MINKKTGKGIPNAIISDKVWDKATEGTKPQYVPKYFGPFIGYKMVRKEK